MRRDRPDAGSPRNRPNGPARSAEGASRPNAFIRSDPRGRPMHYPKVVSTYCPKCKTHTDHEVEKGKKRTASELKWGQRRFRRATRGYGGFPRPKPEGRAKAVRRVYLKFRCKKCKYTVQPASWRASSLELVEKH